MCLEALEGHQFAAGLLTSYVALGPFRNGEASVADVAAVTGISSIGLMTVTNILIDSEFKWLLALFATTWATALVLRRLKRK